MMPVVKKIPFPLQWAARASISCPETRKRLEQTEEKRAVCLNQVPHWTKRPRI